MIFNGIDGLDRSDISVSNAGDVNGDGIDDLLIAAQFAAPNGNGAASKTYPIYDQTAVPEPRSLALVGVGLGALAARFRRKRSGLEA